MKSGEWVEPEHRGQHYLLEGVKILHLLSQRPGEGAHRKDVCRKESKEFLFKIFHILCEIKGQVVC